MFNQNNSDVNRKNAFKNAKMQRSLVWSTRNSERIATKRSKDQFAESFGSVGQLEVSAIKTETKKNAVTSTVTDIQVSALMDRNSEAPSKTVKKVCSKKKPKQVLKKKKATKKVLKKVRKKKTKTETETDEPMEYDAGLTMNELLEVGFEIDDPMKSAAVSNESYAFMEEQMNPRMNQLMVANGDEDAWKPLNELKEEQFAGPDSFYVLQEQELFNTLQLVPKNTPEVPREVPQMHKRRINKPRKLQPMVTEVTFELNPKINYPIPAADTSLMKFDMMTDEKGMNLKITSWSVGSVHNLISKNGIDFLLDDAADIICMQDLGTSHGNDIPTPIPTALKQGYKIFMNLGFASSRGLGILTKYQPLSVNYVNHTEELRRTLVLAQFEHFQLLCVAAPRAGFGLENLQNKLRWQNAFNKFVGQFKEQGKPLFIAGDMETVLLDSGEFRFAIPINRNLRHF